MSLLILLVVGLGIFMGFFIQTLIGFAGALIALPIRYSDDVDPSFR
jgi:hypothetical protein